MIVWTTVSVEAGTVEVSVTIVPGAEVVSVMVTSTVLVWVSVVVEPGTVITAVDVTVSVLNTVDSSTVETVLVSTTVGPETVE